MYYYYNFWAMFQGPVNGSFKMEYIHYPSSSFKDERWIDSCLTVRQPSPSRALTLIYMTSCEHLYPIMPSFHPTGSLDATLRNYDQGWPKLATNARTSSPPPQQTIPACTHTSQTTGPPLVCWTFDSHVSSQGSGNLKPPEPANKPLVATRQARTSLAKCS